jgi:hypothetical protein
MIIPLVIVRTVASVREMANAPKPGVILSCSYQGPTAEAMLLSWLTNADARLVMPQAIACD